MTVFSTISDSIKSPNHPSEVDLHQKVNICHPILNTQNKNVI